jgi:hypothetical protein
MDDRYQLRYTVDMRRCLRLLALMAAVGLGLFVVPDPAAADAEPGGLAVTVRASDPLAPVVVLTNKTGQACQVVASARGTVSLTAVTQDGKAVSPIAVFPNFDDDLGVTLKESLQVLQPGASVDLPLPMVPAGPTHHAIETVSYAKELTVGALYPVEAGKPLTLQALYAAPVAPASGPPRCASAAFATPAAASTPWLRWTLIGASVVALLIILAVVLVLRRRRRRAVAATVLLLAASLVGLDVARPHAASATINIDDDIAKDVAGCMIEFEKPLGDPDGIIPKLKNSYLDIQIHKTSRNNGEYRVTNTDTIMVFWDPNDHRPFTDGTLRFPCAELYHELYHAFKDLGDGNDLHECITPDGRPTGIAIKEVLATQAENRWRAANGLPPRTVYGYDTVPDKCRPPRDSDPLCHPTRGCDDASKGPHADNHSDPHLSTFDGRRYDFMAVGEFWAVRDTTTTDSATALQIQTRQSPLGSNPYVSVNSAVAANVLGDRVEVRLHNGELTMLVNGVGKDIATQKLPKGGGIIWVPPVNGGHPRIVLDWPDTTYALIQPNSTDALRLYVFVPNARRGKLSGLLGDADGDKLNDLRVGGGTPIGEPAPFEQLYPAYADSMRITDATSLFTYPPGTSTATYTNRAYPSRMPDPKSSPRYAWAEAVCRSTGVSDPDTLAACVVDLVNTGQADYAVAATVTQASVATFRLDGPTATMRIGQPGDVAKLTFTATAGQKMYVDVVSSTLPDECGMIGLRDPADKPVANGCVIGGKGRIDAVILPATGTYTIVLDPNGNATGEAVVHLVSAKDEAGAISPDGPAATATVSDAGGVARLSFAGTAGEKVFVDVLDSTLPDECGVISLLDPANQRLAAGCIISGKGYVDATVLPNAGRYTVLIDPADKNTGVTHVRLVVAHDTQATITIGGPAVVATVGQAGAVARLTFTGTAGQKVYVVGASATLPDECGLLQLKDPAGKSLAGGCVIAGKGGIAERDGYQLATSGQYTIVLDPGGHNTGAVTLTVHT